jgi:hypothetical protein
VGDPTVFLPAAVTERTLRWREPHAERASLRVADDAGIALIAKLGAGTAEVSISPFSWS